MMVGKLCSRWIGPFVITNIFSHVTIELQSLDTEKTFKVNGYYFKPFYDGFWEQVTEEVQQENPSSTWVTHRYAKPTMLSNSAMWEATNSDSFILYILQATI